VLRGARRAGPEQIVDDGGNIPANARQYLVSDNLNVQTVDNTVAIEIIERAAFDVDWAATPRMWANVSEVGNTI